MAFGCSTCNAQFDEEEEQVFHRKSQWHRYNLKREVVGLPPVAEALFENKRQAFRDEQSKRKQMYGSGFFSSSSESPQWDATRCFICDFRADAGTVERCIEHMHKQHGLFIPHAESLKDPRGLLSYLGGKVANGFICLYCNEERQPFSSLEAVRNHMISKSHCKLHYGDGDGDEEENRHLDQFYETQIMAAQKEVEFELGLGGTELVIKRKSEDGTTSESNKILGSRQFLRYYHQKPRPTADRDHVISAAALQHSRHRNMCLQGVLTKDKLDQISRLPNQETRNYRSRDAKSSYRQSPPNKIKSFHK
eukprot:PITA_15365